MDNIDKCFHDLNLRGVSLNEDQELVDLFGKVLDKSCLVLDTGMAA